jgi:hypothetical protein
MASTFGSFVVYEDQQGVHISHDFPKNHPEIKCERTQYAGPTVIRQETVPDLNKWLAAKKKEGFTFKTMSK